MAEYRGSRMDTENSDFVTEEVQSRAFYKCINIRL